MESKQQRRHLPRGSVGRLTEEAVARNAFVLQSCIETWYAGVVDESPQLAVRHGFACRGRGLQQGLRWIGDEHQGAQRLEAGDAAACAFNRHSTQMLLGMTGKA